VDADDSTAAVPGSGESLQDELQDDRYSLEQTRHRAHRMALAYTVAGVALIPWTVYLAVSLPRREFDTHYRGAWVGFDLLLVGAIVLTAYYAFRVDTRVQLPATATATLLVVDAWFDVMTAGGHRATAEAVLMAVCIELPAAVFSLWLARRVNHNADRMARVALAMEEARHGHPG
jgi:hypothetical protein